MPDPSSEELREAFKPTHSRKPLILATLASLIILTVAGGYAHTLIMRALEERKMSAYNQIQMTCPFEYSARTDTERAAAEVCKERRNREAKEAFQELGILPK